MQSSYISQSLIGQILAILWVLPLFYWSEFVSEPRKGSYILVISKIVWSLIYHPLQSLAVSPPPPEGDLQGNQWMELLESLEEKVEGQPQQDTGHVCLPQQRWAVDQCGDKWQTGRDWEANLSPSAPSPGTAPLQPQRRPLFRYETWAGAWWPTLSSAYEQESGNPPMPLVNILLVNLPLHWRKKKDNLLLIWIQLPQHLSYSFGPGWLNSRWFPILLKIRPQTVNWIYAPNMIFPFPSYFSQMSQNSLQTLRFPFPNSISLLDPGMHHPEPSSGVQSLIP